jgi:hypothetical protein
MVTAGVKVTQVKKAGRAFTGVRRVFGALLLAAGLGGATAGAASAQPGHWGGLPGPAILGGSPYNFEEPLGVSSDGRHVWVASPSGSVTELNAATGTRMRVISGPAGGFASPAAVSSDGIHVWVTNADGNSVTELSAWTGAVIRVLTGSAYGFGNSQGISSDGADVWVSNAANNTVTGFPA